LLGESAQQQVVHSNVGLFLQSLADLLILKVTCGEVNGAMLSVNLLNCTAKTELTGKFIPVIVEIPEFQPDIPVMRQIPDPNQPGNQMQTVKVWKYLSPHMSWAVAKVSDCLDTTQQMQAQNMAEYTSLLAAMQGIGI
jgi:hypothetical protein